MREERKKELEAIALRLRKRLIDMLYHAQTGHAGGSLSCAEIITALYFELMDIDPAHPQKEGRDRLILSKGHAAPMLYLALAERGFFSDEHLSSFRRINSILQGHPCAHKTPGVELSAGPLGLGLGGAVGMALAERLKKSGAWIYCILGDGEIQEGVVWEAAMAAAKYKTNRLIAILDDNGVQLDGRVADIMPLSDIGAKWRSFGWEIIPCDGHSIEALIAAVSYAKTRNEGPVLIHAHTVKGKGISFMEGKNTWHGKPISETEYAAACQELEGAQ